MGGAVSAGEIMLVNLHQMGDGLSEKAILQYHQCYNLSIDHVGLDWIDVVLDAGNQVMPITESPILENFIDLQGTQFHSPGGMAVGQPQMLLKEVKHLDIIIHLQKVFLGPVSQTV